MFVSAGSPGGAHDEPMSSHLTHFNGRAIGAVLQAQARLCVWYVEQDVGGRLSRRPFWGTAIDYDPSRGLKVWLDGAESEAACEWVDEGDDWEWETPEQAANRYGAVQLKLKIRDYPLCVRLPFKRTAAAEATPPAVEDASGMVAGSSGESPRAASAYTFAKKAKLLSGARSTGSPRRQPLHADAAARQLQAYSAGVRLACRIPPPPPCSYPPAPVPHLPGNWAMRRVIGPGLGS